MYKLMDGNVVVDLLQTICYIRYLPSQSRLVVTDRQSANGVMSSDKDTFFHLEGTPNTFEEGVETVRVVEIDNEEYNALNSEFVFRSKKQASLENEVSELKTMVEKQNVILEKLMEKL